jgi:hypothetical protein
MPLVDWIAYSGAEFAESKQGYFFVYKKFNYELGTDREHAERLERVLKNPWSKYKGIQVPRNRRHCC